MFYEMIEMPLNQVVICNLMPILSVFVTQV
jgi:hypothetical protein